MKKKRYIKPTVEAVAADGAALLATSPAIREGGDDNPGTADSKYNPGWGEEEEEEDAWNAHPVGSSIRWD